MTGSDGAYKRLTQTAPRVDPFDQAHQVALFKWLNSWQCRQFDKAHHLSVAAVSLADWSRDHLADLPDESAELARLTDSQLSDVADAYDDLRRMKAGCRRLGQSEVDVVYGPAGAAKTLFALRPNVCAPWDDPIRKKKGYSGDRDSYRRFLEGVRADLVAIAAEARREIRDLPTLIGRDDSSPPKLIDEYNWVTVTRGTPPPTRSVLAQWCQWAELAGQPASIRQVESET